MSWSLSSHSADKRALEQNLGHADGETRILQLDWVSGPCHLMSCLQAKPKLVEKPHKEELQITQTEQLCERY